jgi:hypothetical protein
METRTSTRTTPSALGTAPPPILIATLSARRPPAASTVGADRPAVPRGPLISLVTTDRLILRARRPTTGLALAVGLFIGGGVILAPDTAEHLSSGDTTLIASPVTERGTLTALALAGAAAVPARKGASA